jgi:CBS domain-containing protein
MGRPRADRVAGRGKSITLVAVRSDMNSSDRVTVADVMSTPLETVSKDETVMYATQRMRELDISALVVPTNPRGIISSTDVLDAVADGRNVADLEVSAVMTEDVETVSPDLYMEEVAAMMETYGINHLPVVDDDYVGMISSTDVTATLS